MNIEEELLKIYTHKNNKKMYRKIYYQKNRKKILDYNNKRYDDRLLKGDIKIINKPFIIGFD
jgi:hypothetical protein